MRGPQVRFCERRGGATCRAYSTVADTPAAEAGGPLGPGQRWSARRKREVVLRMLRGESLEALSRELGVEIYRLEQWRERALTGLEVLLKDRDEDHPMRTELDAAKRHIGELSMENELLRARCRAMRGARPFGFGEVAEMSAATSPSTGQLYGVKRVCTAWELARSSYYAWCTERHDGAGNSERRRWAAPSKRGPVPAVSDADLLAAIRHDLERSPFTGEGHRKVWARLRIVDTIRVSRKRVLRLMREHRLLSPHRPRTHREESHPGNDQHRGAECDVGHRRRARVHRRRRLGVDLLGGRALERRVRGVARHQDRGSVRGARADRHGAHPAVRRRGGRESPAGWRCAWITAPSTSPSTFSTRSSSGASTRASPSSSSPKPTAWWSASTAR